jgi:hypothetical protein
MDRYPPSARQRRRTTENIIEAWGVKKRPLMTESIEHTPRDDEGEDSFKYYCPLCMSYYKDTLVTICCNNYTCHSCGFKYIASKISAHAKHGFSSSKMESVNCAHCMQTMGASVGMYRCVGEDEEVRSYKDDEHASNSPCYYHGEKEKVMIGDGFDTLKRKMISFNEEASFAGDKDGVLEGESDTEGSGSSDTQDSFVFEDDLSDKDFEQEEEEEEEEGEVSVAEEVWKGILQGVVKIRVGRVAE